MPPEEPSAEAVAAVAVEVPTLVAPPRVRRLVPVAPKPKLPPPAAACTAKPRAADGSKPLSAVESKIAALHDPDELLNVMRTEAALRRAQRLSGQGETQRQTIRLLSIFMLFALLAAAVGAMWYLQTSLQNSRRFQRAPAAANIDAPTVPMPRAPVAR